MPRKAPEITVSPRCREILTSLSRSRTQPHRLVERAQIVLYAVDDLSNAEIGRCLGIDAQRARRWRGRWLEFAERLSEAEGEAGDESDLPAVITTALGDAKRPGGPPKFTPEQVAKLISLACEPREESGIARTHWTPEELAKEAMKRGIVESISDRHLDRLLKRGCSTPSQEPVLDDLPGQAGRSTAI